MKKLMVAAFAAVGISFAASASQCMWDWMGNVVDSTGSEFTGGTALLFALTGSDAVPVFQDGAWNLNGAVLADTSPYSADDEGWGASDWVNLAAVNSGTTQGAEQQYFAVILTEKAGVSDLATYVGDDARYAMAYVQQGEQAVYSATDPVQYGTLVENFGVNIAKGDWQTASVTPEPTSGLLLLLGVSGLALRRRRA